MTPHVEFIYSTLAPRPLQIAPDPKVIALFRSVLHPRRFKFSTGAKFDAKLTGIVGIYLASAQRVSVFLVARPHDPSLRTNEAPARSLVVLACERWSKLRTEDHDGRLKETISR